MGEPLSSAAAGTAAVATVAAVSTYVGIDPLTIMFAATGALFGEGVSAQIGKWHKAILYTAVVLIASLLGTVIAGKFHDGKVLWASVWAVGFAMGFQPLASAYLKGVPQLAKAALDRAIAALNRIGGGREP